MNDSLAEKTDSHPFRWPKTIVICSLLAIPISYVVYAGLSGKNHFGQGLEHSFYQPAFWAVQVLAFFDLAIYPCLKVQSERRQGLLMVSTILAFLVVEALSFALIAFNLFPD